MTADDPAPTFEAAIDQLERIVGLLERGDLDLAASLSSYEKGVALLARCQALLDGVDRSVALLTGVDDDGSPVTSPFDATATASSESARSTRSRPVPTAADDVDPPY